MNTQIANLSDAELETLRRQIRAEYDAFRARGLKLDMTRGKPAPEQLDLAEAMLALPGNRDHLTTAGEDARNYGVLQGLPEARALFASLLGAPPGQIVVADNSSLAVMHDSIVWALLKGVPGSQALGETRLHLSCSRLRPPFRPVRGIRHPHAAGPNDRPRPGHGRSGSTGRRSIGERHVVRAEILQSRPARYTRRKPSAASPQCAPERPIFACSGTTPTPSTT